MNPDLKKNLTSSHYWFRALYVLFFVFASEVAATILLFVAIGQIVFTLLTGKPNQRLTAFGSSLAEYLFSVFNFVCCKTEEKPFPFADWPQIANVEEQDNSQSNPNNGASENEPTAQPQEPLVANSQLETQDSKPAEEAKKEQNNTQESELAEESTATEQSKPKDA